MLDIHGKKINFRKWKIKDKNKFIEGTKIDNKKIIEEALVYDCLEDRNIPLTSEEYKYVLLQIRSNSISPFIEYKFKCDVCEKDYDYKANINVILVPNFNGYGTIISGDTEIEMGEIINKEVYDSVMEGCKSYEQEKIMDFIFHIKKIDDSDAFTLDMLIEKINNLDVQQGEDIFLQWEKMKFSLNDTHEVKCPFCDSTELIQFDDLPDFFPASWFRDYD